MMNLAQYIQQLAQQPDRFGLNAAQAALEEAAYHLPAYAHQLLAEKPIRDKTELSQAVHAASLAAVALSLEATKDMCYGNTKNNLKAASAQCQAQQDFIAAQQSKKGVGKFIAGVGIAAEHRKLAELKTAERRQQAALESHVKAEYARYQRGEEVHWRSFGDTQLQPITAFEQAWRSLDSASSAEQQFQLLQGKLGLVTKNFGTDSFNAVMQLPVRPDSPLEQVISLVTNYQADLFEANKPAGSRIQPGRPAMG